MTVTRFRLSETDNQRILPLPDLTLGRYFADLTVKNGDLKHEEALFTSIILQLFTNRRADTTEISDDQDPQGWIGDVIFIDGNTSSIGSHIWLLDRAYLNAQTQYDFEQYANLALDELVSQGVIADFNIKTQIDKAKNILRVDLTVYANAGEAKYNKIFELYWAQIYGDRQ